MKKGFLLEKKIKPIPDIEQTNNRNIYICGCVRNCEQYLSKVFENIRKIIELVDDYKIIIAYDESQDRTYEALISLKTSFPKLEIIRNYKPLSKYRTENISNARNSIINYIKNDNNPQYEYFIMMDFDDVSSGKMNIDILKEYLFNDKYQWDALSFNRKQYYDIWALSIDKYVLSCWHWDNNPNIQFGSREVPLIMYNYITNKLSNMNKDKLLDCHSAFNGFAIYKKNKFMDSKYEFDIYENLQQIPKHLILENMEVLNRNYYIHFIEDCEHRYFHYHSILQHNAKIRISPQILFEE